MGELTSLNGSVHILHLLRPPWTTTHGDVAAMRSQRQGWGEGFTAASKPGPSWWVAMVRAPGLRGTQPLACLQIPQLTCWPQGQGLWRAWGESHGWPLTLLSATGTPSTTY